MEIKQSLRLPKRITDSLRVLIKVVEAVHKSSDLKEIYNTALDLVIELEKVDMAAIYIVDDVSNTAVLQAHRNFPPEYVAKASVIPYPTGITWRVINSGQPLNIDDIHKVKEIGPAGKKAGYHGIMGVPVLVEGRAIGVIWLARYEEERFTRREVELLTTIGNQISIAIARAKQTRELEERNENLSILSAIVEKVHGSADLRLIFETFLDMIGGIRMIDVMCVYLVEGEGDSREAVLRVHRGLSDEYIKKGRENPSSQRGDMGGHKHGRARLFKGLPGEPCPLGAAGRALEPGVVLSLPLKHRGQTIGVIHFTRMEKRAFEKYRARHTLLSRQPDRDGCLQGEDVPGGRGEGERARKALPRPENDTGPAHSEREARLFGTARVEHSARDQ